MSTASFQKAANAASTAPDVSPSQQQLAAADAAPTWRGLPWAVLGNFVYAFSQYAMVVVLAQVATPQIVGQYALGLAIAGPVMFLCSLQLRAILASDARRTHPLSEYWRLRIMTAPIALAVVALIAVLGNYVLETAIVILVIGAAKSLETFSDLCYGASQRDNRLDLVGKSLTFKGPLSVAVLGMVTWATQSVAIGMIGVGATWFALFWCYDRPNARRGAANQALRIAADYTSGWATQRQLLAVGLPLSSALALLSLTVSLPNVLVERYLGERDVGIYAALTSLAWAGVPLINAMGQTAMPNFGQLHSAGDHRRLRLAVTLLASLSAGMGIIGLAGVFLFGELIVTRCYGREYAGRIDVLLWLMAAATLLFAARFFADALTAMRCTRIQLAAQATAAIVVFAGCIAVLPELGLAGVAKVLTVAFGLRGIVLAGCFWLETRPAKPLLKLYCDESR